MVQLASAGITLGVGGLDASTLYYIYVYDNAGTLTLEASTTAYATDATTGVKTKSGDATRTYVGIARTTAGTAWADSETQRFVASYFNPVKRHLRNGFTANLRVPGSFSEVNSEIRIEAIVLAG